MKTRKAGKSIKNCILSTQMSYLLSLVHENITKMYLLEKLRKCIHVG
jgi:hypothetical protein